MQRRPSVLGVATGAIVGLAAVTPGAGYVYPLFAMLIGAVASLIAYADDFVICCRGTAVKAMT